MVAMCQRSQRGGRKHGKQPLVMKPPKAKPKTRGRAAAATAAAAKPSSKKRSRARHQEKDDDDDDDDEEGEDNSSEEKKKMIEGGEVNDDEKKGSIERRSGEDEATKKLKEEAESGGDENKGKKTSDGGEAADGEVGSKRRKGKKGEKGGPLRDQCKSKKFTEVWSQLSGEIRDHFNSCSRESQTDFIHSTIQREKGRLIVDQNAMLKIVKKREHNRSGKELMSGFILEDHLGILSLHPPTNLLAF